MRDLDREIRPNAEREYAYDFDWIIRRYLLREWSGLIDSSGSSLELGAYEGDMTELILSAVPHLEVVEGASELISGLRQRFDADRVTVHCSLFEDFKSDRKYRNVFLVHTLEHIDDTQLLLRKIREEWLEPGGHLFVAVPNANALSRQIAVHMGLVQYNSAVTEGEKLHGHRRTYSLDTVRAEIVAAGFSIVKFGSVLLKTLSNGQFDAAISAGIVSEGYIDAINELAKLHPELGASVYVVATV